MILILFGSDWIETHFLTFLFIYLVFGIVHWNTNCTLRSSNHHTYHRLTHIGDCQEQDLAHFSNFCPTSDCGCRRKRTSTAHSAQQQAAAAADSHTAPNSKIPCSNFKCVRNTPSVRLRIRIKFKNLVLSHIPSLQELLRNPNASSHPAKQRWKWILLELTKYIFYSPVSYNFIPQVYNTHTHTHSTTTQWYVLILVF